MKDLRINNNIKKHIKNGVLFLDKNRVLIDDDVKIDSGVVIGAGVTIRGNTEIGKNSEILGDTYIENSTIEEGVSIKSSHISNSEIGENSSVGPFSHIKQNSRIGKRCRVGNYVEIKNSTLGDNSKCAHLTYIGDAEVGEFVNIGCGVVFANYDGKKKNKTVVGNNVFIGCNCNLIAPLIIEDNCYIAAGTTVTNTLPHKSFCIGRVKQEVKSIEECSFLNNLNIK